MTRRLLPLALLLPLLPALAQDGPRPRPPAPPQAQEEEEAPPEEEEAAGPEVEVLAPGDLEVRVERAGKISTAREIPVRAVPEQYEGQLLVTKVNPLLRTGGPVEQGTVLVECDPRPFQRELRAAREALATARVARDLLEREQRLEEAAGKQELEQAELAARDAARALERFEKVEGPAMLEDARHDLQGAENALADEREELSQLEGMYKGTQLATETKEIVLERARRALKLSEERLAVARTRTAAVKDYEHPLQLRTHQDQARWAAADLARAREQAEVEAARRRDALETAAHAARDAEELLARLEADQGVLRLVAPAAGLLSPAPELRPGDVLETRTPLCVVHEGPLVARCEAAQEDLRVLAAGAAGKVALTSLGEVTLPGTVSEVAVFPGEEGALAVTVQLSGTHALLRFGLACRLSLPGPRLTGVLSVPRRAVELGDGGPATVKVWKDEKAAAREVVLGPGNRERVVVLSGLVAGEAVVVPPEGE